MIEHPTLGTAPARAPRAPQENGPAAGRCPYPHGTDHRKSGRGEDPNAPAIEQDGDVWHVRSYGAVRQVLRNSEATRQAGFNSDMVANTGLRQPVLFQDGAEHKAQRVAIARFFTPTIVSDEYRDLMEEYSDEVIAKLVEDGHGDLGELTLRLAVNVAARVVGLTDSRRPGMDRRLEALLSMDRLEGVSRMRRIVAGLKSQANLLNFYLSDVRPAIAARRRAPQGDVISHLLEGGRKNVEILIECVTYGAAGMVTTREFISMAAWHLLEREELRSEYLAGDEKERYGILHEILRLEPVVGRLYRRATADMVIEDGGVTHHVSAGALLNLDIRAANADADVMGEAPLALCPQRDLPRGVQASGLSFGDGGHRCPGAFIAMQESDIFLQKLLRLPLEVRSAPRLGWNDLVEGYELRGFEVAVEPSASTPVSSRA
ncbi:MAG: cytochrome P450 [Trueperaceae bacterium]